MEPNQARQGVTGRAREYNCQLCEDTTWILNKNSTAVSRCECWINRQKAKKLLKGKFATSSFDNYTPKKFKQSDGSVLTLPEAMKDIRGSYFLAGNYRAGKTHLLAAQYRALTEANFYHTLFVREVDLIHGLQQEAYRSEEGQKIQLGRYDPKHYQDKDYFHFFVDDLGKTPATLDRQYQLFKFFDMIYHCGFGLTVTANYGLDELEQQWNSEQAPAIVRRLEDICRVIEMFEVI
jgi:DNA replication protein DnaC